MGLRKPNEELVPLKPAHLKPLPGAGFPVRFPKKLAPLFKPKRFKVVHGGRGGAKSWGIARALLLLGARMPLRILCTREVQNSIKDSVHRLLSDQVENLGLGRFYEVLNNEIRGANGTVFLFTGLSTQTVESIKSFEGVNIVWVEEAQAVSKRSWDILIPTIRQEAHIYDQALMHDPEIWISLNPELETDETYKRFIAAPPPNAIVIEINWPDNPWFPRVLEEERLYCKAHRPEHEYNWIWEGKCLPAAEGAIYHNEVTLLRSSGRIRQVPFDPLLKTHTIWDLGWNDSMSIILAQRSSSEVRVCHYIEDSHRKLSDYIADLRAMPGINWGADFIPHDGYSKDYKTGKSAEEILIALGRKPMPIPNVSIENGIKAAREVFPRVYVDESADRLIECLKNYKRSVSGRTNEPGAVVHDQYSHGADAFRYLGIVADQMTNDEWGGELKYPDLGKF